MSLGSIVVRLSMNTADFDTDAGRAAKIAEKRASQIDASFRKAGKAIGAALGAAVIGIGVALKSTIDRMDEMSKSAQKVGLSTEEFSKLSYAAGLADVSMETLVGSLGKLTKAQASAMDGTSKQAKVFEALGIAVKDADGNLRESSGVLADFADRFKALEGSPEAMAAGFALFGRSFQEMIPLLKDGGDGIRAAGDELERMGGVLSTEAGQQAELFNDNLDRLKTVAHSLAMEVASNVLPGLIDLTERLLDSSREGGALNEVMDGLQTVFGGVVSVGGSLIGTIESITSVLGGISPQANSAGESLRQLVQSARGLAAIPAGLAAYAQGIAGTISGDASAVRDAAAKYTKANAELNAAWKGTAAADFSNVQGGSSRFANVVGGSRSTSNRDMAAGLRGALGGSPRSSGGGGGGAARKAELTDEQKAVQKLGEDYKRLNESMAERIGLFGAETEVAKLTYDTQLGELAKLGEAEKANLLTQAAKLDQLQADKELQEEGKALIESLLTPTEELNEKRARAVKLLEAGKISQEGYNRAIESYKDPGQQMLEDLQFELELLKMTNAERQTAIQLRGMDAEQIEKYGEAIGKANEDLIKLSENEQFLKFIKEGLSDAFVEFATGAKTAKEAFGDFADELFATALRFVADQAINAFFDSFKKTGTTGSTGGAGGGFDWAGLFSSFFGGARAGGGYTNAGKAYLVGEKGPELFMPNTSGTVVPSGPTMQMMGGGGGTSIVNFSIHSPMTPRTQQQAEMKLAQRSRRALARNS